MEQTPRMMRLPVAAGLTASLVTGLSAGCDDLRYLVCTVEAQKFDQSSCSAFNFVNMVLNPLQDSRGVESSSV